jgi:hypothetical protein
MRVPSTNEDTSIAPSLPKRPGDYVIAGCASNAGTTIGWYDFFLCGAAAVLVFNKIFLPALDPIGLVPSYQSIGYWAAAPLVSSLSRRGWRSAASGLARC